MGYDDRDVQERKRLLDEIRRRAEEAELARIEVEEAKFDESLFPSFSTPDAAGPDSFHFFPSDAPQVRPTMSPQQIAGILQSARDEYEAEHYARALELLGEVTRVDPGNEEARSLSRDVEKAKALSERLREEEELRRKEEQSEQRIVPPAPPVTVATEPVRPVDIPTQNQDQTTSARTKGPGGVEIELPTVRRTVTHLLLIALSVLGLAAGFVVYRYIRTAYFPPAIRLLILPPSASGVDPVLVDGLAEELVARVSHLRSVTVFSARTTFSIQADVASSRIQALAPDYVVRWHVEDEHGLIAGSVAVTRPAALSGKAEQMPAAFRGQKSDWCDTAALHIASALGVGPDEMKATLPDTPPKAEAYDLCLQGRALLGHAGPASLDSIAFLFERAREIDPSYPYAESALGWTRILQHASGMDTTGKYLTEAESSLKRAVNLGGNSSEVYRLWGMVEYFNANPAASLLRLEHAAIIAPSDPVTQHWLAQAYFRNGKNALALRAGQAAMESDPSDPSARSFLGILYLANDDARSALAAFDSSTFRDLTKPISHEYIAALAGANQHERALDILKKSTQERPRDFVARYELGRMFQLAGKPKTAWEATLREALSIIDDTLKVRPDFVRAYAYRGLVQTRLGMFTEGAGSIKNGLRLAPGDAVMLYDAVKVCALQQKYTPEAIAFLERAVDRQFLPDQILDLDMAALRARPEFARALAQ